MESLSSDHFLRTILDAAPFGMQVYELLEDDRLIFLGENQTAAQLLGRKDDAPIGKTIEDVIPCVRNTEIPDQCRHVASREEPPRNILLEYARDSRAVHLELHVASIRQRRVAVFIRDSSERNRVESQLKSIIHEKEVLLKEVHHRVKNNLQVISSLLSLQSAHTDDPKTIELFRESQNRVKSMALVHERLYRSENMTEVDFGEYVRTVVVQLVRSYGNADIACTIDTADVRLSVDAAIPCGLIVNELVSNAAQTRVSREEDREIQVSLREQEGAWMELTIADDGIGFPQELDFRTLTTMGMTLITSLTGQLGGTIDLDRTAGSKFIVRFPAPTSDQARHDATRDRFVEQIS